MQRATAWEVYWHSAEHERSDRETDATRPGIRSAPAPARDDPAKTIPFRQQHCPFRTIWHGSGRHHGDGTKQRDYLAVCSGPDVRFRRRPEPSGQRCWVVGRTGSVMVPIFCNRPTGVGGGDGRQDGGRVSPRDVICQPGFRLQTRNTWPAEFEQNSLTPAQLQKQFEKLAKWPTMELRLVCSGKHNSAFFPQASYPKNSTGFHGKRPCYEINRPDVHPAGLRRPWG